MRYRLIALAALSLLLVACNGDDSSPESAVNDYTEAWGSGEADTAWGLLSKRCQAAMDETEFRASVAASGEMYPGLEVTEYSESIDGDTATVDYETSSADISQAGQRWISEDGDWKFDDC